MQITTRQFLANCALVIVLFFGIASDAVASPIQFIHEGRGAGSINGAAFAETDFVITAFGDTSNRGTVDFDVFDIDHDSAQISIDGVGDYSFVTPTRTFVNQGVPIVGFSRSSGSDLFNGPSNAGFTTWDLLSSIGPITGNGSVIQWDSENVNTSGGVLLFDRDESVITTFTAIVVPEPTTLGLAGIAIVACFSRRFV